MLQISDLTVRYGSITAVSGLSLDVNKGEIVGLIGHNGAGKTSTVLATTGILKPAGGRITFEGTDITGARPDQIVSMGLGLVPERRRIFTRLSVHENLLLATTPRKDRAAARADIARLEERFEVLGRLRHQHAGLLSGGEQQQLAIARALVPRPRLLLLDEPSLGLAPRVVDQIFDLVSELRDEGTTVFLIEQNAARTIEIADRFTVLRAGGRVAFAGTRETVGDLVAFQAEYLGFRGGE